MPAVSAEWVILQERLRAAKRVVDLGCGADPHPRASVCVDAFLEPEHRTLGYGPRIDVAAIQERGQQFVLADLTALPFHDKEFDFAYSHHAFEHLPNPKKACAEMCRIARAGAIITPSVFSEIAFGRPYHLWLVLARGNTLVFVQKMAREDRPFGEHPMPKVDGGYRVTPQTNPFEILLNYDDWYRGREQMARLSRLLQGYWYSHSPVIEVVLLWDERFNCLVVHEDGHIE